MKILYIHNDTLKYGGTEAVMLGYQEQLSREENITIDFMVHTTMEEADSNGRIVALRNAGTKVFIVTPRRISVRQNREDIEKVLTENKYDIVHAHADCVNYLLLKIAKKCGVKVRIAHSHNTSIPIRTDSVKGMMHYLYLDMSRRMIPTVATHYMGCSDEAVNWLFGPKRARRAFILKNAIDTSRYEYNDAVRSRLRSDLGLDDCFVIGHIGSFLPQKNHRFLLDLFARVAGSIDSARLLLVGDGPLRGEIEQQARTLGIIDRVTFAGVQQNAGDYLQAMDVFAFPSLYEGLSVALLEAQCSGLKCLVNDLPTISKNFTVNNLVSRLPFDDIYAWSKQIIGICETDRTDRHSHASELSDAGYDINREGEKLAEYYRQIV